MTDGALDYKALLGNLRHVDKVKVADALKPPPTAGETPHHSPDCPDSALHSVGSKVRMMQGDLTSPKKTTHSLQEDAAVTADTTKNTADAAAGKVTAPVVELATAPPEYKRYAKLLGMGVSKETVFAKMTENSPELDPAVLGVAPCLVASAGDGATGDNTAASDTCTVGVDVSSLPEPSVDKGAAEDEDEAVLASEPEPLSDRGRVVQASADGHELNMTFAAHFAEIVYVSAVQEVVTQEEAEHTAAEQAQAKANAEMLRNRTGVNQNALVHRYNERQHHRDHLQASIAEANQHHRMTVLAKLSRKHNAERASRDAETRAAAAKAATSSRKKKHARDVGRHRKLEDDRHANEAVREASHYFEDVLNASSRIKEMKAHKKHNSAAWADVKRRHKAADIQKARAAEAEAESAAADKQAQAAKKKKERLRLKALQHEREQRQTAIAERKEAARLQKEAAELQAKDAKAKAAKADRAKLKKLQREHTERSKAHVDAKHQAAEKARDAEKALQKAQKAEHMARIADNSRRFERFQRERVSHHIQAARAEELANLEDENELAEAEMEARELETNGILFGYVKVAVDEDRQNLIDRHKHGLLDQIHAARERRAQAERDCQLMTESVTNQAVEAAETAAREAAEAEEYEKTKLAELQRQQPLTPAKQRKRDDDAQKEALYGRIDTRLEDLHRETWQVEIKALVDEQNQELATYDIRTRQRRKNELRLGLYTKPGKRSQKTRQMATPPRSTRSFRSVASAVRAGGRLKAGGELISMGTDLMSNMMMSKSIRAADDILDNGDISDEEEQDQNNFEQELAENEDLRREMELLESQVQRQGRQTSQAELDRVALVSARDDAASDGIGMTISNDIPDDDEMAAIDALIRKRQAGLQPAEVADRSTPSADKPEPEPAKPNVVSAVEAARERRRKAKADA